MALSLIVFAGFYPPARSAIQYADILAQAVNGRLVLLHVNRASLFDPNDLIAQGYQQEELTRQTDTAAILYHQAEGLLTKATVEVATDLLPAVAQDLAHRYQPALFVLSQADEDRPAAADLLTSCAEILRAGSYPLLVVSPTAPAQHPPRRILIAADRESFALAPNPKPCARCWPCLVSRSWWPTFRVAWRMMRAARWRCGPCKPVAWLIICPCRSCGAISTRTTRKGCWPPRSTRGPIW